MTGNTGSTGVYDNTGAAIHVTSAGGYTNAPTLSVTGTASGLGFPAVNTFDNGALNGGGGVYNGVWQSTISLTPGDNIITAGPQLGSGVASADAIDVVYEPGAPNAVIVTVSQTGGNTNAVVQTLSGTVSSTGFGTRLVAGTALTLSDDGTTLGRTSVAADGTWSARVTLPYQGVNAVTVSETDLAGNSGATIATFNLKTSVPAVAVTSPGGAVSQASQVISGTATAGDTGDLVTISEDGTVIGNSSVGPDGTWSLATTLGSGSHTFQATDADRFGNVGVSNAVTYVLSPPPTVVATVVTPAVTAPSISITSPGGLTKQPTASVSGLATAGSAVTVYDDGTPAGAATAAVDGNWAATVTLIQGANLLSATDATAAGTAGSNSISTVLDTTPPAVTISAAPPVAGATTATLTVTVSDASGVAGVEIYEGTTALGPAQVNADGTWSFSSDFGQGSYDHLSAVATDMAGNTATALAPSISITSPGGLTKQPSATVSGLATAGSAVTVYDDGTPAGATTAAADGSWTVTATLVEGVNVLAATDATVAGTAGSNSISTILDTTPPAVTISAAPPVAGATTATMTGTVSDASGVAGVEIYEGTTALGPAQVNADGTWSFASDFGQGRYDHLSAVATDMAGNTAAASALYDLITGIAGRRYTGEVVSTDASGATTGITTMAADGSIGSQTVSNGDGTATATGYANGQTLLGIGSDVMTGNGMRENFVFQPNMGHARITDFVLGGAGHDTITLSHQDFDTIAQLLAGTTMSHGAAVIHVTADDTIRLAGVTKAQLAQHKGDFAFAS